MNIDMLAAFFLWCTVLNGSVLMLSAIIFLSFNYTDWISRFYCRLYNLPKDTLNSIGVLFIAIYKVVFITFNLTPYIALLILKHIY